MKQSVFIHKAPRNYRRLFLPVFLCLGLFNTAGAQKVTKFNLHHLYDQQRLTAVKDAYQDDTLRKFSDGGYSGLTCSGRAWLDGADFSTGSIDIDLRGRDAFQNSFLGIAFHGQSDKEYESIYFRPFNFQSPDTLRSKHQVQYIYEPEYPWDRLRKEHPLVYEHSVTPALIPTAWFHAHIVVTQDSVIVFVNHSNIPSLKIKRLNTLKNGRISLWDTGYTGDFANLVIISNK